MAKVKFFIQATDPDVDADVDGRTDISSPDIFVPVH